MITMLPVTIKTAEDAKSFLTELYKNGESFHPEDDATTVGNRINGEWVNSFTKEEGMSLNGLMNDIYALPGNNSASDLAFDPCEFLLNLDEAYVIG